MAAEILTRMFVYNTGNHMQVQNLLDQQICEIKVYRRKKRGHNINNIYSDRVTVQEATD